MSNTPDYTSAESSPPADNVDNVRASDRPTTTMANDRPVATPVNDRPMATPVNDRAVATPVNERPVATPVAGTAATTDRPAVVEDERRDRALRRFRGLNIGAAFFGWLVGVGLATILTAIVAAAGAALSLTQEAATKGNITTLSISGVVILAIILLVSYYAGGYVAGRLSRFSGPVQGIGVWVIGLVVTAALAIAGVVAGSKYNVLSQLRLPSIPVNGQSFATGGAVALAIMAVLTLLAAILGAGVGINYHRRVDRLLTGRRVTPVS